MPEKPKAREQPKQKPPPNPKPQPKRKETPAPVVVEDEDEENGDNSSIYKIIFFILLIVLGGVATLVLIENNSAEDALVVPSGIDVGDSQAPASAPAPPVLPVEPESKQTDGTVGDDHDSDSGVDLDDSSESSLFSSIIDTIYGFLDFSGLGNFSCFIGKASF